MTRNKKIYMTAGGIMLLVVLFSCKTIPPQPNPVIDETGLVPLEPGGSAYILIDVVNARPILNELHFFDMNGNQTRQILDKSQSAVAAVYAPPNTAGNTAGNNSGYRITAWGSYPASAARMALGASKGWKKFRSPVSGQPYWYSTETGTAVAINAHQAFAAKNNAAEDPFSAAGTAMPEGFTEFRAGSVLSCWLENPGPVMNKKMEEAGIPLEIPAELLFISLFPAADQNGNDGERQYQARLRMRFSGAAQARALTMLFTLAKGFLPAGTSTGASSDASADGFMNLAALFFANPPEQDGDSLIITTNGLSGRDIALLFNMFSLL